MKKYLLVLMALALTSGVAFAQPASDTGTQDIRVTVRPNIAVTPDSGLVELSALQRPGPFTGLLTFRVDANTQLVDMSVQVSNLYKDGDPGSIFQIPVYRAAGVLVNVPLGARQPDGLNPPLALAGTLGPVGVFQGYVSSVGTWGSGDADTFSLAVEVTPTWNLLVETPQGPYRGTVILTATVVP